MTDRDEALRIEEQALFEQEQALIEMEAQLHAQEEGLAQMERAFLKRNQSLVPLLSYVSDQEKSLISRAEAIGPKAKQLAERRLLQEGGPDLPAATLGKFDERGLMIERRRELLAARMELIEEREALYAARLELLEGADARFGNLQDKLLAREKVITETLRELITRASDLSTDEGDEDADEDPHPAGGRPAPMPRPQVAQTRQPATDERIVPSAQPVRKFERERESDAVPRGGMKVVAGQVEGGGGGGRVSTPSRTDDQVALKRRGVKLGAANQFRITLEAVLGQGEKHTFFRYGDDGPEDLPGLFLATPNLLKEGREVKLKIKLDDGALIETMGVVSWRRLPSEKQGPPGMGIELASLAPGEKTKLGDWLKRNPPVQV